MKKGFSVTAIIFFIINTCAFGQEVVFQLPWGDAENAVSLRETPEGFYGPQSFKFEDNQLQILDNGSGSIKIFQESRFVRELPASSAARDFAFLSETEYVINVNNELIHFTGAESESVYSPPGGKVISSLHKNGSRILINYSDGSGARFQPQNRSLQKSPGNNSGGEFSCRLVRKDASTGLIQILDDNGFSERELSLEFENNNLASLGLARQDKNNNLFIYAELFISQIPLEIERRVYVIDTAGSNSAVYKIPLNTYAHLQNDITVDKHGNLYFLSADPGGVKLLKWSLPKTTIHEQSKIIGYPEEFNKVYSPEIQGEFEGTEMQPLQKTAETASVTPEYALMIGDSYDKLQWVCSSQNLTNGIVVDSYGNHVRTPDWLYVGDVQRVPYKWGGFQTIQQFVDGIAAGKYAGDNYTDNGGTPSAVGVDCSGFVSRCWKLSSHHSTRMMPSITEAYDNWLDAKPGDACHKVGHVRLIVGHQPNGTIDMVESAGFNWRVSYTNYSYAGLSGYMPRYYVNMEGTPGRIPQPRLLSALQSEQAHVSWTAGAPETIYEFVLQKSADGQNWTESEYISADSSAVIRELAEGESAYFRMYSISNSDSVTSSLQSDVYGIYKNTASRKVLLVDGFDRTSGSWAKIYHPFAAVHGAALQNLNIPFETAANESVIDGSVVLSDYEAVVWILGDESTVDQTFNSTEQALVSSYLKQGGNLFISGSEVSWDLDEKGTVAEKNFLKQYLKASMNADDANSYTVSGSSGTPFAGLTLNFDSGSHGVYEEDYPDALNALDGGQTALKYANGKIAAVYFSGMFPGGHAEGRLFYMGFPFETIYTESRRNELMQKVMSFFEMDITDVPDQPAARSVDEFKLYGNYPNPFNAETKIKFSVPSAGSIAVEIYNSLGQLVMVREKTCSSAGEAQIKINVAALSSGKFFYKAVFNNAGRKFVKQGSFVLLK